MTRPDRADPQATGRRPLSRRALLATGATALAVGAGATELANAVAGSGTGAGPSTTSPPDVDLMEEHGVLQRVLLCYQAALEAMAAGAPPPTEAIHAGARVVHDFIEGFHEPLEEGYVFPTLRRAGQLVSTVDTLLVQHARGRQRTQVILAGTSGNQLSTASVRSRVTTAMELFVRMYQPHEAREDTVVYPAWRALLSPGRLDELAGTFADLQVRQFGSDAFAAVVRRVAAVERALGVYDLAQVTPPALPA